MSNAREDACQIRGFLDGLTPASTQSRERNLDQQSIWKRTGRSPILIVHPLMIFFYVSFPVPVWILFVNKVLLSLHHVLLFSLTQRVKTHFAFATMLFNGENESKLTLQHWTNYAFDRMNDKTNSRAIRQTLHAKIFLDEFKLIKRENLRNKGAVIYERTRARERERKRERL